MYREHHSSSRMFVGLAAVLVVHSVLIAAFKMGFVSQLIPLLPPPMQAVLVEPQDRTPPPPPRIPTFDRFEAPVVDVVPPSPLPFDPMIDAIQASPVDVAIGVSKPNFSAPAGAGPEIVENFRVDSRYPLSRPEYPQASVRLQEEGTVVLRLYVLTNGRIGDVKVQTSSGYPRLDEAAMREARRSWRFKPRTVNGAAVESWESFAVTFRLEDR